MTIDIDAVCSELTAALKGEFGGELLFVGLQGSRGRGEAAEESDIDIAAVVEDLDLKSLDRYENIIKTMSWRARACGFICGRRELIGWDPAELFHLYWDTTPLIGDLEFIRDKFGAEDAERSLRTAAGGIYHGCCHNSLYEKSPELLTELYKGAFFALRAKYFVKAGTYIKRSDELERLLDGEDAEIIKTFRRRRADKSDRKVPPERMAADTERLLNWSSGILRRYV